MFTIDGLKVFKVIRSKRSGEYFVMAYDYRAGTHYIFRGQALQSYGQPYGDSQVWMAAAEKMIPYNEREVY